MATINVGGRSEPVVDRIVTQPVESSVSAISWGSIIAGSFTIAALSLILLALGSGFGLTSVSPWPNSGVSVTTFTAMTAIWLVIVQWLSSAVGGYLTGRLRTKWAGVHTHEVFFRDTAHGLLAWALAAVIGAALLASAVSSLLSSGTHAAATVISGAAEGAGQAAVQQNPLGYYVDSLFRSDHPDANASNQEVRAETTRILAEGVRNGDIPNGDKMYLAQLVAARTGLSQADAERRVNDVIAKVKAAEAKVRQAADAARKAGAYLSVYAGVTMLIGAFIAAVAAALGGRHRDEHWRSDPAALRY